MEIRRADLFLLRIPLKISVRHALAERDETNNLVVRLEDESGREGWGEGVPRPYVTGEDPDGAFEKLLDSVLPPLVGLSLDGPDEVPDVLGEVVDPRPGTQSCCCAAELALLDLAGRAFERPAIEWLGGARRETVEYGGVVPLLGDEDRDRFFARAKEMGLRHLKLKVEGDSWLETLERARLLMGEDFSLAVDANGCWDLAAAVEQMRKIEPFGVNWVEQPLARGREEEIPLLAEETSIPIMVDESLTTMEEAERLIGLGGCGLFNVRLSKVGGMTAARRIALRSIEAGLEVQVGCQVGETAVLSAAGRVLAASLPAVRVVEGSYGTMLLSTDLTEEPFEFGAGGVGPLQKGHGLGVEVSRKRLDGLTVRSARLE